MPTADSGISGSFMKAVFIDIDNTLLDFDEYVRTTMIEGFSHFGLKPYEPYMYEIFHTENDKLWHDIELGRLTIPELRKIRWQNVFNALGIDFDGPTFEAYFVEALNDSAIPVKGAYELLEGLKDRAILCAASNGPYEQQLHRLRKADMLKYFSHCFISEDIGANKPTGSFYEESFRRLNEGAAEPILPGEVLSLGDSVTSDIKGGIDYGMKTCYYRHNNRQKVPENIAARIDLVADSLTEALDKILVTV